MVYENPHLICSPAELDAQLGQPDLVILDARPPEDFANGHIRGARSLDIFGISLIDTRPDPLQAFLWIIEHLIGAKGVSERSDVVVYDRVSGERSARLFWFLEFFGHAGIRVLNGGFSAWQSFGGPVTHEATVPKRTEFRRKPVPERLATADDVLERLGNEDTVIVDVRSTAENQASLVRSARGGRIPGAVHLEWKNNLTSDGTFRSADALATQYEAIGVTRNREIIPYCQGGYRSANTYLALRLIGYPRLRNYLGSWGEWGNRTELPIETPPYD
jgi:thiosulfate/3-mercaptopyruvate sulfurtransferase